MDPRIIDGKYEVIRQLGTGGMGVVFEARNLHTSRRVAIKVIASAQLAKGADTAVRFKREARAAGALETQHAVQVLDAGADPSTGDPYIVMELLSGEDLKQLVQRLGPLDPDVALRIVAQACAGLRVAHEAGIIHRDIKSANLFLARREGGDVTVKIVDFGIAKVVADSGGGGQSADLTHTGSVLGSPRYMSPEQGKGQRDVSPRSDLWSLGIVLYEMLTGTTPHAEIDGVYALVVAICNQPAPPVQERAPWVSPECAAIVHRALQIDPDKRFASAAEMLEALRALLPEGPAIHESALLPVPEQTRLSSTTSYIPPRLGGSPAEGTLATSATSLHGSQAGGARGRSRKVAFAALSALSLVVAGAFGIRALSGRAVVVAEDREAGVAALPPAPSAPSAPAPEASAEAHGVRLGIAPGDATVEIDGRPATVKDGAVELFGAIGSVHQVHVVKGAEEATMEVAITYRGAVPPQVAVETAPVKRPVRPASGAAPAATARPAEIKAAPPPPSKDPPPATKFE